MWLMLAIINGILAVITQDTIPTILFSMCTICAYLERIEAAVKSKTTGPSAKKKVMDTELTGSDGR